MKYKAVLFDLDDTLLKTASVKWAQHKTVAKHFYNIDLTDEILAEHWGKPFETLLAIFYQHADTPENRMKNYLSLADQFAKEQHDDALEVIHILLKAQIEIGVITSSLGHLAKKDLRRFSFPIDSFFLIQGADDAPNHKPNPQVFDPAFQLLQTKNIQLEEILYIGDALMDYYAARDAGIGFIGVTTGMVSQNQFEAAGALAASSLTHALQFLKI